MISPRSAKKTPETKAKKHPHAVCPLPPAEYRAVKKRARDEGLDVAKWLRRLIRREMQEDPKL